MPAARRPIEQSSESIAAPADPVDTSADEKPQSSSWSTLMPQAKGTESSAWIPATRLPKGEDR